MTTSTAEVMSRGMQCLTEGLGVVEAERFISVIIREQMDYTKWQRQFFDAMAPGEFGKKALEYAKEHPFKGKAKKI